MTFHRISDETLHILMEYFEELGDLGYFDQDFDIELSVSNIIIMVCVSMVMLVLVHGGCISMLT